MGVRADHRHGVAPAAAYPAVALRIVVLAVVCAGSVMLSAQSAKPLPESALPMKLVGVALDRATPAHSLSFIRCPSTSPEASAGSFGPGQTACHLAEIAEVREHAVVVRNLQTKQLEVLTLGGRGAGAGSQPQVAEEPPVVTPARELVAVDVRRDLVDHYLANLDEVLSSALATPRRSSGTGPGAIDGFVLDQVKPGGAAERLGFQNGDVIVEVNGVKLDSLDTVLQLMSQAPTAKQVQMSVLRGGQPVTFVFNTR